MSVEEQEEEEWESAEMDDRVVLKVEGVSYDVTDYIPVHPGEGHNDLYMEDYAGQDVTKEWIYYHSKKEATKQMLERVQQRGKYKKILLVKDTDEK